MIIIIITFSSCMKTVWLESLFSKFMSSQPGKQTNVIHVLSNISRSKGKHTIKFGQLIEYKTRSIFLEKSYTECGGETISSPFS